MILDEITTVRSGSIGDVVHSRNPHGTYTRARTTPFNPATLRQGSVRLRFRLVSRFWSGALTRPERTSWAEYASRVALLDRIGERQHLSGQQMFVRCNASRTRPSMGIIRTAPTGSSLGVFMNPRYNSFVGPGLVAFGIDSSEDWTAEDGAFMIGYVGAAPGPNRIFFKGPWRFMGAIAGNSVTPATPQVFVDPWFTTPNVFGRWGRAVLVRADGRAANPLTRAFDTVL